LLEQVDERGGAVACIESGWMQEQIQEEAYRAELAVVSGEKVVVGVNRYTETEEAQPPLIFRTDERAASEQLKRLRSHRQRRDAAAVTAALAQLRTVAEGTSQLMPTILDAVRADATLGEICGTLRDVFGEYRPPTSI
jgi:methylmalonyl-CoA mutase N-terminal domain/subunit